jgi:hypothetical protein
MGSMADGTIAQAETPSAAEVARLAELEQAIDRGKADFRDVCIALLEIRARRLYRGHFATFDEYCRARLGFSGAHGGRIADCYWLFELCDTEGLPPPENSSQARHARRILKIKRKSRPGTYAADAPAREHVEQLRELLGDDPATGYRRLAGVVNGEPHKNDAGGISREIDSHLSGLEKIHALHPLAEKGALLLGLYRSTILPWPEAKQ